jgi:hypothetical protein
MWHKVLVAGVVLCVAACGGESPVADSDSLTSTSSVASVPDAPGAAAAPATTTPDMSTHIAIGNAAEGFAPVEDALAQAQDLWAQSSLPGYGYLLDIDCDCPEASSTWVRQWPHRHEDMFAGTPEDLFSRIRAAIDEEPDRIEVEFSTLDGHPVSYRIVNEDGERTATIDHFHQIQEEGSPFDGRWRLVSGSIDGESFGNPASGGIFLRLSRGRAEFPIDCNQGGSYVDIFDGWFGMGFTWQTDMGCGEPAPESAMFTESLGRAETIRLSATMLLLSGPGVKLNFTNPQAPELAGELPLTAAGQRLSFDAPGQESTNRYIITPSLDSFGHSVLYLLTAESDDSDTAATWQRWQGEPDDLDNLITGTDPHTIVVPDDITNGDVDAFRALVRSKAGS